MLSLPSHPVRFKHIVLYIEASNTVVMPKSRTRKAPNNDAQSDVTPGSEPGPRQAESNPIEIPQSSQALSGIRWTSLGDDGSPTRGHRSARQRSMQRLPKLRSPYRDRKIAL